MGYYDQAGSNLGSQVGKAIDVPIGAAGSIIAGKVITEKSKSEKAADLDQALTNTINNAADAAYIESNKEKALNQEEFNIQKTKKEHEDFIKENGGFRKGNPTKKAAAAFENEYKTAFDTAFNHLQKQLEIARQQRAQLTVAKSSRNFGDAQTYGRIMEAASKLGRKGEGLVATAENRQQTSIHKSFEALDSYIGGNK